jgi:hypothetical protein
MVTIDETAEQQDDDILDSSSISIVQGDQGNSSDTNEVQTVSISVTATGGTFTLTLGTETTGPIAYDPTDDTSLNQVAADIETALEALDSVNAVTVLRSGTDFEVTFTDPAYVDQPLMTVDNITSLFSGVTGGSDVGDFPQYAVSATAVVDASGSSFGADEEGATAVLSLAIEGGNGTYSGFKTTDGDNIVLWKDGDLILGLIDEENDGVDGTEDAAFAIAILEDGRVATAQ